VSCRHTVRLWHNARTSLRKTRVQLIGELDAMIHDLPEPLQAQLPTTVTVRARVKAVATLDTTGYTDPVVLLRLQLIEHRVAMLTKTLAQDEIAETALTTLVAQAGTTLVDLAGVAARAAAEILVETGDVRRFTEAGFAQIHRHRTHSRHIRRGRWPAGASPPQPRRQPAPERRPAPHGDDPAPSNREPELCTTTPASAVTPAERPCAFSSGTSPTPSTEPCFETPAATLP